MKPVKRIIPIVACIVMSALLFYFSDGLKGQYGYLLFLAPVPILILTYTAKSGHAFIISFIASFLGRLGWLKYLGSLMPVIPALIVVIMLSLVFAIIVVITGRVVRKTQTWYTVFAFPLFFATYEFILINFSYDGSAASVAYSLSDYLPVVQIASVTGLTGITFIATFIASLLSLAWYFKNNRKMLFPLIAVGTVIPAALLIFGFLRLNSSLTGDRLPVALIVQNEDQHKFELTDNEFEIQNAGNYAAVIQDMAKKGIKLAVLPERALNINKEIDTKIRYLLCSNAKQNGIAIITGYSNYTGDHPRNSAMVIDDSGNVLADYDKVHLVKGLEGRFSAGNKAGIFPMNGINAGIAICKDMDYPGYIKQYGKNNISFLCIPAWDFGVDGWLHSRMSVMRGVENGISEIRTARTGRLTISDPYGRVTAEASSEDGKAVSLTGYITATNVNTVYSMLSPDWFGILCAAGSLFFIVLIFIKNKNGS